MLKPNLGSIRCYVDAGFSVIAEPWMWYREAMATASAGFAGLDVGIVRLECDLAELERREAARGSTFRGTARRDFESMPAIPPISCLTQASRRPTI